MSHKFTKDERVRKRNDFIRVYSEGRRYVCPEFIGFYLIKEEKEGGNSEMHTRLGMSVGRKFGNAVARNRIKRLIREIFRLNKHLLRKGCDVIIQPKQMCKYEELEKAMFGFFSSAGLVGKPDTNKV